MHQVLKKEMNLWKDRIYQVIRDNPTWSEVEVTMQVYEEVAVNGAKMLHRDDLGRNPVRATHPTDADRALAGSRTGPNARRW